MIDGQGPFDFVLDTAATRSAIAVELAHELGYEVSAPPAETALGTMAVKARLVTLASFAVARASSEPMEVAVADLEPLIQQLGSRIRGIIGFDFFQFRRITIDYRSETLTLD